MKAEEAGQFTSSQRLRIRLAAALGWLLIRILGSTLRFAVTGGEHFETLRQAGSAVVFTFWHNQIIPAAQFFRFQGIAIITSRHLDGEYIARIVRRFGYRPVRGSSSRGGARVLMESLRILREGGDVAFTLDGPRGPRYQVKPGPILLARRTGAPVLPFHIQLERFWQLRSWDHFRIPKPFSRASLRFGRPLWFGQDVTEEEALGLLQQSLDQLRVQGEADFGQKR